MRKPCYSALMQQAFVYQAVEYLHCRPEAYNNYGRNSYCLYKETEEYQGIYIGSRKYKQVRAEDAGYRPACADHRDDGGRLGQGMGVSRNNSGRYIKQKEPQVSKPVFYIIAEYPEIQHITPKVEYPAMQEHRREDCRKGM